MVGRVDRAARREYVEGFNSGTTALTVTVATATPGASWEPLLGTTGPVTSRADGRLTLTIPALGAILLRAGADLPVRPVPAPAVKVGPDRLSELQLVSASLKTADPATVSFALRRAGKAWTRVAVDDSAPYRAFLDPARFRRGEKVQVVAIARGSDGSTAVSPVVVATPRPKKA